jgi:hypothetical protein
VKESLAARTKIVKAMRVRTLYNFIWVLSGRTIGRRTVYGRTRVTLRDEVGRSGAWRDSLRKAVRKHQNTIQNPDRVRRKRQRLPAALSELTRRSSFHCSSETTALRQFR